MTLTLITRKMLSSNKLSTFSFLYHIGSHQCRRRYSQSNPWMNRHIADKYVQDSMAQGYRSRAAFKLLQIQQKYKILPMTPKGSDNKEIFVLDVGSAPGGWSQVLGNGDVFSNGKKKIVCKVTAIDLLKMDPLKNVNFIQSDFAVLKASDLFYPSFHCILSDASPNLSGIHFTDSCRSLDLVSSIWNWSKREGLLREGGSFLCKLFRGNSREEREWISELKREFEGGVEWVKPDASRDQSAEIYLLARKYRYKQ